MTTLLVDLVIVFWLLLFGAMALLPIITGDTNDRAQRAAPIEDRVISIRPAQSEATDAPAVHAPAMEDNHHRDRTAA